MDWLDSVMAEVSGTGTSWNLASKDWDGGISAGDSLGVRFIVGYSGNKVSLTLSLCLEMFANRVVCAALSELCELRHCGL